MTNPPNDRTGGGLCGAGSATPLKLFCASLLLIIVAPYFFGLGFLAGAFFLGIGLSYGIFILYPYGFSTF
jgi:hypothetical protein